MSEEEIELFKSIIDSMKEGRLSKIEKIIFVIGIQGGMYSDDDVVRDLLDEVADLCLIEEGIVKTFEN